MYESRDLQQNADRMKNRFEAFKKAYSKDEPETLKTEQVEDESYFDSNLHKKNYINQFKAASYNYSYERTMRKNSPKKNNDPINKYRNDLFSGRGDFDQTQGLNYNQNKEIKRVNDINREISNNKINGNNELDLIMQKEGVQNGNNTKEIENEIQKISKIKDNNDFNDKKLFEQNVPAHIRKNISPEEYSIVKNPIMYLNENEDINFSRDISSYSRYVFSNTESEYEKLSYQFMDPKFINFKDHYMSPDDDMMLDIASDKITDQMLQDIIKREGIVLPDKKLSLEDFKNEGSEINEISLIKSKPEKSYTDKYCKGSVGTKIETNFDQNFPMGQNLQEKVDADYIGLKSEKYSAKKAIYETKGKAGENMDIKHLLSNIINAKNLKKPLKNLPHETELSRKITHDVNIKLAENLNLLAQQILEKRGGT